MECREKNSLIHTAGFPFRAPIVGLNVISGVIHMHNRRYGQSGYLLMKGFSSVHHNRWVDAKKSRIPISCYVKFSIHVLLILPIRKREREKV